MQETLVGNAERSRAYLAFSHPARSDDIEGEAAPLRWATINVLFVVANSMKACGRQATEELTFGSTGRLLSMKRPIKSAIKYLLACRRLDDSPNEIDLVLSTLAVASGMASMEQLIAANAEDIIDEISEVRETLCVLQKHHY